MLPKNSKHFIQPTADELDCSTALVNDVVSFFYKDVRKNLIDMSSPNIQVENLGSFKAKRNELPKLVAKYTKHLDVLQPETMNQVTLQRSLKAKLQKVLGLQKQIDSEKLRKTKFIQAKNERKTNPNME